MSLLEPNSTKTLSHVSASGSKEKRNRNDSYPARTINKNPKKQKKKKSVIEDVYKPEKMEILVLVVARKLGCSKIEELSVALRISPVIVISGGRRSLSTLSVNKLFFDSRETHKHIILTYDQQAQKGPLMCV